MNIINRFATIVSIGFSPRGIHDVLDLVEIEARQGGDLILLPETCLGSEPVISLDGPEIASLSRIAAQYKMYVVFPAYRKGGKTGRINSAILIDRSGKIAGVYDKVYPFWSEFELDPPTDLGHDATVFETDFGKVGMAICFDANFPDIFKQMSNSGAELVLWPSAYSAGTSLQAHAINYNFIIISSTMVPDCVVYDITGRETYYQKSESRVNVSRIKADLDRCIFHTDYNTEGRDKLLREHAGDVESDVFMQRESWFTLRAIRPGVSAKALATEYGLEELRNYKSRSEEEIDNIRGYRFTSKTI